MRFGAHGLRAVLSFVLVGCGGGDPPRQLCGNGVLEQGELCEKSQPGCSSDCQALCGDGIVGYGEACEPPQAGCSADCRTLCGNGYVEPGELCDVNDPNDHYCAADCRSRTGSCGDGVLVGLEDCDDANMIDNDGCTKCKMDPGYLCTGQPSVCKFGPDSAVDPSTVVASATSDQFAKFCNWLEASLGGEGAHLSCGSMWPGFAVLNSVNTCIDSFSTKTTCAATFGDIAACWEPVVKGGDVCAAAQVLNKCAADACAGPGITQCTGAGCPGAPCGSSSNCTSGTHCSGDGRGWCACDVPAATGCQTPTCTTSADCAKYGPGIDCISGSCSVGDRTLPQGAACRNGNWCRSGTCTNGTCTGDYSSPVGSYCEYTNWCGGNGVGMVHCCAKVCTEVELPEDCTAPAGGDCAQNVDCFSNKCVDSRCM